MSGESTKDKLCPACGAQTLTRIHRTIWQRLAGLSGQTKRYRCLFCGHEFLERTRQVAEVDGHEAGPKE